MTRRRKKPRVLLTMHLWRVACLVADGMTDEMIATALGIHRRTANAHVFRIAAILRLDLEKDIRSQITAVIVKHGTSPEGIAA